MKLMIMILFSFSFSADWLLNANAQIVGQENAALTAPPLVPPAIARNYNTKVIVNLDVIEKKGQLTDGVDYTFWTFGGTVPGSFIRVKHGDWVEFHLKNDESSKMPHNIDLHAVTGPGGGAQASFTLPGKETVFSFRALNPGIFVYHCATAPVGMHIANGMYGLILVEPKEGLPKVNREYYFMQGDFYTHNKFGKPGFQYFDMEKAIDERPSYVLFNGSTHALTGDNAMVAKAGETIRFYFGNGGPNLTSAIHLIGEVFDRVYVEGGSLINENVQTTSVPPGGAVMLELKAEVPARYSFVDHAIFRTFNKGALAILKVEGAERPDLFETGKGK